VRTLLRKFFNGRTEDLSFKERPSGSLTPERIKKILGSEKVSFLIVDCYCIYEGVKKDIKGYLSLVSEEKIIVFHHIYLHLPETVVE
jgi:hypothetical protein